MFGFIGRATTAGSGDAIKGMGPHPYFVMPFRYVNIFIIDGRDITGNQIQFEHTLGLYTVKHLDLCGGQLTLNSDLVLIK